MPLKLKNKTAFSLIELSIVILIVGVIVAGVTQSSRLIGAFKLNTARTLTQSSPVASINGLLVWFDTAREESLSSTLEDGDDVLTWTSINPQSSTAAILTAGSGLEPTYETDGIGGLPTLDFNAAMMMYDTLPIQANYSIFMVFDANVTNVQSTIMSIYTRTSRVHGALIEIQSSGRWRLLHRSPVSGGAGNENNLASPSDKLLTANRDYIFSYIRNYDTTYTNAWMNNTQYLTNQSASRPEFNSTDLRMEVGQLLDNTNSRQFDGQISEIIIFDRALKQEEVDAIETYLSKKYSITLS